MTKAGQRPAFLFVDRDKLWGYTDYEVKPMKKEDIFSVIRLILAPVLVIVLGLVLIFNPDSASAFISKLLGWILICIGVGVGLSAVFKDNARVFKGIVAVIFAVAGGWLVKNPLALAAWIGRIIGVLLVIDGVQDIVTLRKVGKTFLMPLIVTVVGVILVVMPMATSRLVFSLCGIVVLIIGVGMLLERLKTKKRLQEPKDDIIDAL